MKADIPQIPGDRATQYIVRILHMLSCRQTSSRRWDRNCDLSPLSTHPLHICQIKLKICKCASSNIMIAINMEILSHFTFLINAFSGNYFARNKLS
jgi:hypothetical protein